MHQHGIYSNATPFPLKLNAKRRLTSPECSAAVFQLELCPLEGESLRPFIPGQIVRLGLPGVKQPSPGYFAIASEPENTRCYEFVIKRTKGIAQILANAKPGTVIECDGPMGKGFDLNPYTGFDIYLLGVGTGIAPLRSVWRSIIRCRKRFGRIAIYAGFLTPLHRLLTDELDDLANHDIHVTVSVSSASASWSGPIGFVQDALRNDAPDGSHAVACIAGMNAMVDACKQTLQDLGFDENRILLNY